MAFEDDVRDLVAQYDPMMAIPERDLLTWLRDRLAMPLADEGVWSQADCQRAEEEISVLTFQKEGLETGLKELRDQCDLLLLQAKDEG